MVSGANLLQRTLGGGLVDERGRGGGIKHAAGTPTLDECKVQAEDEGGGDERARAAILSRWAK